MTAEAKDRTPEEIKASVKDLMAGLKDGEGMFRRWLESAIFEPEGVVLVPNQFIMDWVSNHYDLILSRAYGFPAIVRVMPHDLRKEQKKQAPAPRKKAEVVPIKKAQMPKMGFAAKEMVLLNLPHKDPKENIWERTNGTVSLFVQGGYLPDKKTKKPVFMGVPYGSKARLVLFWLMTEALRLNSRKVYLGRSFDAFLEVIGTSKQSGGKGSGREAVIEQVNRIIAASFSVYNTYEDEEKNGIYGKKIDFAKEYELWFTSDNSGQYTLFDNYIELSEEFFKSLKENPVPFDWEIILKLEKDTLSIDLYVWLSFESAKAQHTGKGRFIPYAALGAQMGAGYSQNKNFGRRVREKINKIKELYQELKVSFPRGGVNVDKASLPSVGRAVLENKQQQS